MPYVPDIPDVFPPTVTICGSTRFWEAMAEAAFHETAAGRMVLAPAVNMRDHHPLWADPAAAATLKAGLDALHLAKINCADEVLVVTDSNLYLGESTRREVLFAEALEVPVRYWIAGLGRAGTTTLGATAARERADRGWKAAFDQLTAASPAGPDRDDLIALAAVDLAVAEHGFHATADDAMTAARTHLGTNLQPSDRLAAALATRTSGTSTTDFLTTARRPTP
ncbi:hypothetical protein P3T27_006636 [Kitasatospora sp. MAA19]|uniref:hypothetical protein n=1 Tax=Kitasatospora sp. MAA19 TaxID=3035090 RepID=UPI00247597E8|nr:hypothetical protein [Kitasatospora sp. MAA19]MDH6709887.1 hypothetical protein [Kitasatospora sp. MAA19]